MISFDTETDPMQPALGAPPLACVTYALDDGRQGILHWTEAESWVRRWLLSDEVLVAHNASFDMAVLAANYPDLLHLIWDAYRAERIWCSMIWQKVADIATGRYAFYFGKRAYDLSACSQRHGGPELDKSNPWRMRFGELRLLPLEQWPADAVQYALDDAPAPGNIVRSIVQKHEPKFPGFLECAPAYAWMDFCLQLGHCHGVRADHDNVTAFAAGVEARLAEAKEILLANGLLRANRKGGWSKNLDVARARVLALTSRPKATEKGRELGADLDFRNPLHRKYVSLDAEALDTLGDPIMDAFSDWTQQSTLQSKVEDLRAGVYVPLQPSYNIPLATGRTSCRKPSLPVRGAQLQNPPARIPGFRECIRARPGHCLISVDIDCMELCTLAQVCYWIAGFSRLMEALNAGLDPHRYFGAQLERVPYEQCSKPFRAQAKPCNFGFPGGMGAERFVGWARAVYKQHFTVEQVKRIKQLWKQTWPEMGRYFAHINDEVATGVTRLITPWGHGRYRGGTDYCAAANEKFQGLGALGSNAAYIRITEACYIDRHSPLFGCRAPLFIHDETICEVPLERCHEAGYEMARLTREAFQEYTPNVRASASPAAMLHWNKDAKTVHDARGRLIPWTPQAA